MDGEQVAVLVSRGRRLRPIDLIEGGQDTRQLSARLIGDNDD